jgi:pyruvate dehydrogenase E1 component
MPTPPTSTPSAEPPAGFPGSREIERRIKSIIRWNAMAMVVRANRQNDGIGGHISTYCLQRHPLRGGLQPFFHAQKTPDTRATSSISRGMPRPASMPGPFGRGASARKQMENFRRELQPGGGLSSYPHPT